MKYCCIYFALAIWINTFPVTFGSYYSMYNAQNGSPFHRNKFLLGRKFLKLVERHQESRAMAMVRAVVEIEKAWRVQYCVSIFGAANCSEKIDSANPFFLWKRKMIHKLKQDPTEEIFDYFRNYSYAQLH